MVCVQKYDKERRGTDVYKQQFMNNANISYIKFSGKQSCNAP